MTDDQPVSLSLRGATVMPARGPFSPLTLDTTSGTIEARLYQPETPRLPAAAILWLGDAVGGFDSPAEGLYDRLAERFQALGVASLRLQYRSPADHAQSGLDALVAAFLLVNQGFERIVAVGHGSGALGAVQCALAMSEVVAVAAIAPAPFAIEGVERLSPRPLLVLQGTEDRFVSTASTREFLAAAGEPKRVYYYQGADHSLDQAADAVTDELGDWLAERFGPQA
jgi:fermentation-respiration switch protein FrsA (DUF1100 family)